MTDLSKYKAFPEGHVIPFNTKVICLIDAYGLKGREGVTIETNVFPFCNWENGQQKIGFKSHLLAPLNPQDHPDFKMETLYIDPSKPAEKREFNFEKPSIEPEWQPKTGELVTVNNCGNIFEGVFCFTDEIGRSYGFEKGGEQERMKASGMPFFVVPFNQISKPKTEPIKLTRAEIAEKFGTDNFEIID
jgi:hypothetical protein